MLQLSERHAIIDYVKNHFNVEYPGRYLRGNRVSVFTKTKSTEKLIFALMERTPDTPDENCYPYYPEAVKKVTDLDIRLQNLTNFLRTFPTFLSVETYSLRLVIKFKR